MQQAPAGFAVFVFLAACQDHTPHRPPPVPVRAVPAVESAAPVATAERAPDPAPPLPVEAPLPAGTDQLVHRAADMEWGPCPPGPLAGDGCGMAVLEGDPGVRQLFTIRLKTTAPFVLPPHTHPGHERVTVLAGTINVGFGDRVNRGASTRFEAGDYYVTNPGAHHFVWTDEPVVLQLTGIGPWQIVPITPQ